MIPNIQLNETSPVIAVLHKMMQLLHLKVDTNEQQEQQEQRAGEQTQLAIREFQKQNQLPVDAAYVVDKPTINFMFKSLGQLGYLDSKMKRTISGKVQMASGKALHRVSLGAIDLDLPAVGRYKDWQTTKDLIAARDTIEFLGLTESGQDGHYEITFYDWMYEKSERRSADVVVFALNKEEGEPDSQIIGRSALFQNVGYHTSQVDIVIEEAVKERGGYKPLFEQIEGFLEENKMAMKDIFDSPDQISFIASELGIDLEKVQLIVLANFFNATVKENLEPELLYGLGRKNVSTDWTVLHQTSTEVLEGALKKAIEEKDIDTFSSSQIDAFINTLKTVTAAETLKPQGKKPNIANDLLAISLTDRQERIAFTKASNQYIGTDENEFWEEYLPKQTGLKVEAINRLRLNQKLFVLSGAHLPLVQTLASDIKNLQDLVQWDLSIWGDVVSKTGFPTYTKGENEGEKAKNYATELRDNVNKEFPTAAVQHKITSNSITIDDVVRAPINQFLNTTAGFDIKRSKIKDFKQTLDTIAGDKDVATATIKELNTLQRLVRINPDTSLIQNLKDKNLLSATAILQIPKKTFIKQYSDYFGGAEKTMMLYATAAPIVANVDMAFTGIREHQDFYLPKIMGWNFETAKEKILENWPGYSEVFNVNLCECRHCNSVYSPAAYFVDLMRFLGAGYDDGDQSSTQEIFKKRRPDLFHLPLSCENSNTLVPYIDLANEVMENYIYYTDGDADAEDFNDYKSADTGNLTEKELRAQPQNIRREASMTLAQAIFPINLPFHLPLENLNTYSNQLGTSWHEILSVTNNSDDETTQRRLTAAYLQLSENEFEILVGQNFEARTNSLELHEIYGFSLAADMATDLKLVPEFLTRSGLEYTELIRLLKTNFINPNLYDFEYLNFILKNTDFSVLTDVLDGIGTNLYNSLNILSAGDDSTPIPENLSPVLDANELSQDIFRAWIQDHFEQIKEVITLYQEQSLCDLPTTELRSLKDVHESPLTELSNDTLIRLHTFIRLWRKLNWTMEELDAILSALGNTAFDPELLHSITFAKQLLDQTELSPKQVAILWGTLDYQRPENLYAQLFLKRFNTVDEVFVPQPGEILFGDLTADNQMLSKYTSDILAAFKINEETLLAIYAHSLEIETAHLSLDNLSLVYRYILFAKACEISVFDLIYYLDMFGFTPFENPKKTLEAFTQIKAVKSMEFTLEDLAYVLGFEGLDTTELKLEEDAILERGKRLQNEYARIDGLTDKELQVEDRSESEAARLELKRDYTYQQVGDLLRLTPKIIKALSVGDIESLIESETFNTAAFKTLINTLHKAAATILGFLLTEQEVLYFAEPVDPTDFSGLDLKNMEVITWWRLYDYVTLKEQLPKTDFSLIDIFNYNSAPEPIADDFPTAIHLVTQWNKGDIEFLLVGYNPSDDFRNEIIPSKMSRIVLLARQMGIAVETLFSFNAEGTTEAEKFDALWNKSNAIKSMVRAKYDDTTWTTVATKLNDQLREKQRDALVAHLLNTTLIKDHPMGITNANGLYEFFLIDVQMSACMDTSRIVQASAAIQQFINRTHLNLEEGLAPDTFDRDQWQWMQHYRVWEAQMRVLYENYTLLNPEWRQDKSPFFDELVSHLTQNDITERTAEEALRGYLKSMSEVANLNVAGSYEETDKDGKFKCLHVFGHTNHSPYTYYYRTWNNVGKWSAWEKVDAAIQQVVSTEDGGKPGVHLIPLVWKNRLMLFWPEFMEKTERIETDSRKTFETLAEQATVVSQEPKKYWEVRLAWSEYYDKKWTAKQVSDEYFTISEELVYEGIGRRRISLEEISFKTNFDENTNSFEIFLTPFMLDNYRGHHGLSYSPIVRNASNLQSSHASFKILNLSDKILATISKLTLLGEIGGYITYNEERSFVNKSLNGRFRNISLKDKYRYNFEKTSEVRDDLTFTNPYLRNEVNHQLLFPNQLKYQDHALWHPFFYSAEGKTYFVKRKLLTETNMINPSVFGNNFISRYNNFMDILGDGPVTTTRNLGLDFSTFHHPFVTDFISNLNKNGVSTNNLEKPGLMESDIFLGFEDEKQYDDEGATFDDTFDPNFPFVYKPADLTKPLKTYYKETIDFDPYGANSKYNWELFFHAPLHIATELSKNGKHKEAIKWFHYIFDPTTDEVPTGEMEEVSRFWKVKPFKTTDINEFEDFLTRLFTGTNSNDDNIIKEWRDNPFNPHLVASNFPVNYMKNTVLLYVQNLVDMGDSLFRRFTRENVYEAIQWYVLASHILGPKPPFVPKRGTVKTETYDSIKEKLGELNAWAELENSLIFSSEDIDMDGDPSASLLGSGLTSYFCVPPNEKLMQYWETVEDRLFKIRNCKDINGIARRLALFAPPIDPAAMIKAKSAGLDLSDILDNLYATPSHYRFGYLLQKANEFCNDVKGLGNALLSALEKQDGEALSRLRAAQEIDMLNMIQGVKERQILDAQMVTRQLLKQRETAIYRFAYYNETLLGNESVTIPELNELDSDLNIDSQIEINPALQDVNMDVNISLVDGGEEGVKIIPKESEDLDRRNKAMHLSTLSSLINNLASPLNLIPSVSVNLEPFGVGASVSFGGSNLSSFAQSQAGFLQIISSINSQKAALASTTASYIRREQEWANQANLVAKEIELLERQILSAGIRLQVAEKDLENHKKQIENAERIESYLKDKFTSKELYGWMKDQLNSLYKQSYDLAFEMAKKAEMAFEFEKNSSDTVLINYDWDSSKYGLLAGEKLQLALRKLDIAYQEENTRQFELTKHISLKQLNPIELIRLKETGKGSMKLFEELFDLDYPGHFNRRIKSVSISIPCVVGPYTTIPCTLQLVNNHVRVLETVPDEYKHNQDAHGDWIDDERFKTQNIPVSSIATSSAQNDSGVYELNFRDERYVPFEGAGAISSWNIELFHDSGPSAEDFGKALRQFDYSTISDVIIHVRYTAEENGTLKEAALDNVKTYFKNEDVDPSSPSFKIFDLKHDFPSEWHRFLHPDNPVNGNILDINLSLKHFSYRDQLHALKVNSITVLVKSTNAMASYSLNITTSSSSDVLPIDLDPTTPKYGDLYFLEIPTEDLEIDFKEEINWQLSNSPDNLFVENEFEEMFLILNYGWA